MATVVEQDLLSVTALESSLQKVPLAEPLLSWLEAYGGYERLQRALSRNLQQALSRTDSQVIAKVAARHLRMALRQVPVADLLAGTIKKARAAGRAEQLWQIFLDQLILLARKDRTRAVILNYLNTITESKTRRWWQQVLISLAEQTGSLNLPAAAAVLQQQLVAELTACKRPDHPLYRWYLYQLLFAERKLARDPHWQAAVTGWYQAWLDRLELEPLVHTLVERVRQAAITPAGTDGKSPVEKWAYIQVNKYWQQFRSDAALQGWVEDHLRRGLKIIIGQSHRLIGQVVRTALESLTDSALNEFIEKRAGEDLAWIRINGSVVGGIVGLLLYLTVYFVFDPYIAPILREAWY